MRNIQETLIFQMYIKNVQNLKHFCSFLLCSICFLMEEDSYPTHKLYLWPSTSDSTSGKCYLLFWRWDHNNLSSPSRYLLKVTTCNPPFVCNACFFHSVYDLSKQCVIVLNHMPAVQCGKRTRMKTRELGSVDLWGKQANEFTRLPSISPR